VRIISIGCPVPSPNVDNHSIANAPSIFDYDACIIDPQSVSEQIEGIAASTLDVKAPDGRLISLGESGAFHFGLGELLEQRRRELQQLMECGGLIVMFIYPSVRHPNVASYPGLNRYSLIPGPEGDPFKWPSLRPADGKDVRPAIPQHPVSGFLDDLGGRPVVTLSPERSSPFLLQFKRLYDLCIGVVLLAISLPVMLVLALLIKATSSGSVLYRQTRCGLNGRRFTMYKLRTMVPDADQRKRDLQHLNTMQGPAFKLRSDPRITPLGRYLRKFSLDELPQFWNVVRGDMSLVGPRPLEEKEPYTRRQRRRLSMKPGITCLWQISGRSNLDFDRWMELDIEYIDTWSPRLDFLILLKTIPAVLSRLGAS